MRHKFVVFLALAVLATVALTFALADDSAIGGSGANVFPTTNTDISLEREYVCFYERENGFWDILTVLYFFNPTPKSVALRLGFPVHIPSRDESAPYRVFPGERVMEGRFQTFVNGARTKAHLRQTSRTTETDVGEGVYLFQATFPPRTHTIVQHNYSIQESGISFTYVELLYLLRTGGNWKGAIEEAVFDYRFRDRPPSSIRLNYADAVDLVGAAHQPNGQRTTVVVEGQSVSYVARYVAAPQARLTVSFYDFKPNEDLAFRFTFPFFFGYETPNQPEGDCNVVDSDDGTELARFYYRPEHPITEMLLGCYRPDWLRNLIYASYGYEFQDEKWNKEFYDSGMFLRSSVPFDDAWLTPGDRAAIEKLKKREAAGG